MSKKFVEGEDIKEIFEKFKKEDQELIAKFKSVTLLEDIKQELSIKHLKDDNLKVTAFLVAVSGLLSNPSRRMSLALTGDSSVGKDNLIKTILSHMPYATSMFLTKGTTATIEDNLKVPILALSEMNLFRDFGANKDLLEVVKQRTEGGITSMKKDLSNSNKTAKITYSEQGTVFYGSTDNERDKEMETRFIFGDISADYDKIKLVNENTFDTFSDCDLIKSKKSNIDSWVKLGLTKLKEEFGSYDIVLPFAKYLKGQINGQDIFDYNNARSMRDVKRLLSLTCATTFLHSFDKVKDNSFIKGTVTDFIETLTYSIDYFNQTYSGLDARLKEVLTIIDDFSGTWCPRDLIEEKLGKAKNTIKNYCTSLSEAGLIEGIKGSEVDREKYPLLKFDGNKIYYRRCQKGVKKPLIRCQVLELKEYLESKLKEEIDTLTHERYQKEGVNQGVKYEGIENNPKIEEIDTFSLTPFIHEEVSDEN